MAILRNRSQNGYTIIDNCSLKDENISLKALGLLVKMLSLPDNWDFSEAGLIAIVKDGQSSVRSGLKELEQLGYLTRTRERSEDGRLGDVVWEIRAVPVKTAVGNPQLENPNMETPSLDSADNKAPKESTTKQSIFSCSDACASSQECAPAPEKPGEPSGKNDGIDYYAWRAAYEENAPKLPRMRLMNDKRRAAVRSMVKQGLTLRDFIEACRKANASSFLLGGGSTGWRANADWMFNASNVVKVLEGNYDDGPGMRAPSSPSPACHPAFCHHKPEDYMMIEETDPRFLPGGQFEGSWC